MPRLAESPYNGVFYQRRGTMLFYRRLSERKWPKLYQNGRFLIVSTCTAIYDSTWWVGIFDWKTRFAIFSLLLGPRLLAP